uniref:Uncharacterized protein n=1 Tax=Arundo donax TaxID=35708 RepID=A0A0A9EBQ0_ARUDO
MWEKGHKIRRPPLNTVHLKCHLFTLIIRFFPYYKSTKASQRCYSNCIYSCIAR